ncbi:MAG: hypothetical protein JXC32_07160 [Anaerolineae bacterium]|nr:hypothetical protein [Anaerolineae bacterium]
MDFGKAFEQLRGAHDLRLSAWGPYTKRYIGISHIPDPATGLRVDLSVFPGLYRRGVHLPNVLWESGYHPWLATPDLSFVRHRHELVWRDQVYADIDTVRLDEMGILVWARLTNATDAPQNLALHWMASLHVPPSGGRRSAPLQMASVQLPERGLWVEGLDYAALALGHESHRANLSYDGLTRGEVRVPGFVGGFGLGQGFALSQGDVVTYRVAVPKPISQAVMVLRYRMPSGTELAIDVPGYTRRGVRLQGTGEVATREIPLRTTLSDEAILTLAPADAGVPVEIDGFALVPGAALDLLHFTPEPWNHEPRRLLAPRDDTLMLTYDHVPLVYGLAWGVHKGPSIPFWLREFFCDDLDATLRIHVHEHVRGMLTGPGTGHYTNVFQRPIFLEPNTDLVVAGLICAGDDEEVRARLTRFDPADPAWGDVHTAAEAGATGLFSDIKPSGQPYRFSQARMAATVLTNVVYPVRTRRTWIRHYTPGRWWDSLYTWDSGFIGLGLAELDLDRALDNLNAYLTEPGTEDAAFIHHGTPLPTQFYVFLALWERTQSQALLHYMYPRLRQYHRFMAGRLGSSTMRTLRSGLIRTWDYFYNSGGWDDYPPQVHVRMSGLRGSVAPVVSTSQVIRTAKIMRNIARALGESTGEYEEDIEALSQALHRYAWDEQSGYFGYVTHDASGAPTGILRHESGANFNMGMDGASPLVAGVCTPEQETRLVAALMSPERMWSPCGLTTVDQSAPYYRDDGYWNGAVWMPHQWFFWRALLDLGDADAAHQIAATALDVWQTEVARSYNCFEHFIVRTGRGAGWHHFGGLSSPVLVWFGAYHRPGRLTVGFDTWVEGLNIAADAKVLTAKLRHNGPVHHAPTVIAAMAPGSHAVSFDGVAMPVNERYPGTLEIQMPAGPWAGTLRVSSI